MERYKLENGEIIECDYINYIHPIKINAQDLKHMAKSFCKEFIKGCTWGLANGYSHLFIIRYYIKCKLYAKYIPTNEPYSDLRYWIRYHKIHENN